MRNDDSAQRSMHLSKVRGFALMKFMEAGTQWNPVRCVERRRHDCCGDEIMPVKTDCLGAYAG